MNKLQSYFNIVINKSYFYQKKFTRQLIYVDI